VRIEIKLDIEAQPDDRSCGPTCLSSLYRYYASGPRRTTGAPRKGLSPAPSLKDTIAQIHSLDSGGTLAEILGCDALKRGYNATIYTYHLQMFDPSWFADDGLIHDAEDLAARLDEQVRAKPWDKRLKPATRAFKEFVALGGKLRMTDLTPGLIRYHISQGVPIVAGLSSTYLYGVPREHGPHDDSDDIRGEPQGHFVMLVGYDTSKREVLVADPLDQNPPFHTAKYRLSVHRLINAVLLGILTYDANLLVIEPGPGMRPPTPPVVTDDDPPESPGVHAAPAHAPVSGGPGPASPIAHPTAQAQSQPTSAFAPWPASPTPTKPTPTKPTPTKPTPAKPTAPKSTPAKRAKRAPHADDAPRRSRR
jgi:hypothetical protein